MHSLLLQIDSLTYSTSTDSIGTLAFILGLVKALAWPLAAFGIALLFKKQIIDLVKAIRKIRLGQLEAEIERVREVREEAVATISQLRDLGLALATPTAETLPGFINQRSRYISSFSGSAFERLEQAKRIVEALTKLGVERSEAEKIMLSPITEHFRNAHVAWIRDIVNEKLNPEYSKPLSTKKLDLPVLDKLKERKISVSETRDSLRKMLEEFPKELQEWLEDLEHFDNTKELRRPSIKPWSDSD